MPASNMSIQTTSEPSYMDRPSMKEDDHPEHNMPSSEYDGASPKPSEVSRGNIYLNNRAVGQAVSNAMKNK